MGCSCDNIGTNKKNGLKNENQKKGNNKRGKKKENDCRSIDLNKERDNVIGKEKLKNLKNLIDDEKKKFNQLALKQNNQYRKLHRVEPLKFDEYLYKRAFIIAQQYLTEETIDNENLSYKNGKELGMNAKIFKEKLDEKKLMGLWYKENEKYNYKNPKELECNNFTQMIWKDSKKFGIGYYSLPENGKGKESAKKKNENKNNEKKPEIYYYVALYYPAGNLPDEYEKNVLCPDENSIKELNDRALSKNNKYRQLHGVEPLEFEEDLYKKAIIIAQQYLIEGSIDEHNLLNENEEKLGKNVYLSEKELGPEELMDLWYKENEKYDYSMPNEKENNNFTQMIWKDSKQFGIGFYCDTEDDNEKEEEKKNKNKKNKNENIVTLDNGNINDNEITIHPQEKKNNDKDGEKEEKNFRSNKSPKKTFYYVALYYPAGNVPGQFKENVLKPLNDESPGKNNEEKGETNPEENQADNDNNLIDNTARKNDQENN